MRKRTPSKKEQTSVFKNLKDYLSILFGIGFIFYFIFLMVNGAVRDYMLDNYSEITEAKIIDKKNYWARGAISNTFSYHYRFEIDDEVYERDSRKVGLAVGQKVEVEYLPSFPSYNRLKEVQPAER